jgi:hypothetical protein
MDALISLYIVNRALQLGIPRVGVARMVLNVGIEGLLGAYARHRRFIRRGLQGEPTELRSSEPLSCAAHGGSIEWTGYSYCPPRLS